MTEVPNFLSSRGVARGAEATLDVVMLLPNRLNSRHREPELMDQPGLDVPRHQQALRALQRVNWLSGTVPVLWRRLLPLAPSTSADPLRVLDLASGAGDVAIGLARTARQAQVAIEIEGCDISPTAVEFVQQQARRHGLRNVRFTVRDVLRESLPGDYDVVTCTLFLHHLAWDEAIAVLQRMGGATRGLVLVDDLCRSWWGYTLSWFGTRLLTRSPVVHTDGLLSVAAAFTREEVGELARAAGLNNASVTRHWPQRFLLSWSR